MARVVWWAVLGAWAAPARGGALPPAARSALERVFSIDDLEGLDWEGGASLHPKRRGQGFEGLSVDDVAHVMNKGGSLYGTGLKLQEGWDVERRGGDGSFVLHGADRRWIPVRKNCDALTEGFGCPCSASIWHAAAEAPASAPHYNKHDTFVQQAVGARDWALYTPASTAADAAATTNALFLPRKDQAPRLTNAVQRPEAFLTDDERQLETTRPGDLLYLPRGVVQSATPAVKGPSLHVSYYLKCAEERTVWEELLHLVLHSKAVDAPLRDPAPQFECAGEEAWVIPTSAVFHLAVRAASDASPVLRGAVVGLLGDEAFVAEELQRTIIPTLVEEFLGLDAEAVAGVNLTDARLKAWVLAEAHTSDTSPMRDAEAATHRTLLHCVQDHLLDLVTAMGRGASGGRRRYIASEGFEEAFTDAFADAEKNKLAVKRFAAQRRPHIKQHMADAKAQLNQQHSFTKK
eukprot:TRINITY_DN13464_c0_g1_i1.p1 TRINITY_DN13464_c0_g1~~TRINITY_DN13464_c0_g1_i1.p1  ORF type:complete len:462 (+),score=169.30 TRINITY_DN13464_c0_g1_i1:88-1473(+)